MEDQQEFAWAVIVVRTLDFFDELERHKSQFDRSSAAGGVESGVLDEIDYFRRTVGPLLREERTREASPRQSEVYQLADSIYDQIINLEASTVPTRMPDITSEGNPFVALEEIRQGVEVTLEASWLDTRVKSLAVDVMIALGRMIGISWADLGAMTNTSGQACQQRYKKISFSDAVAALSDFEYMADVI